MWNRVWKQQKQTGRVCLVKIKNSPFYPPVSPSDVFSETGHNVKCPKPTPHQGNKTRARLVCHPREKWLHLTAPINPKPCNAFRVENNITLPGPLFTVMVWEITFSCFCGKPFQVYPQLMNLYSLAILIIRSNQAPLRFFFSSYSTFFFFFPLVFSVQNSHFPVVLRGCWNKAAITDSKAIKSVPFPWHGRNLIIK